MGSGIALFPGGGIGAGLLVLRLSVTASMLMLTAELSPPPYIAQFLGIVAAVGLCVGLQTRVLAGLCLLASLLGFVMTTASSGVIVLHTVTSAALALTGPGAFSADARLFGRRTIKLPDRDDSIV
jgi:hypothetical protein